LDSFVNRKKIKIIAGKRLFVNENERIYYNE